MPRNSRNTRTGDPTGNAAVANVRTGSASAVADAPDSAEKRYKELVRQLMGKVETLTAELANVKANASVATPVNPYANMSNEDLMAAAFGGDKGAQSELMDRMSGVSQQQQEEPEEEYDPYADLSELDIIAMLADPSTASSDRQELADELKRRTVAQQSGDASDIRKLYDPRDVRQWGRSHASGRWRNLSYTGPLPEDLWEAYHAAKSVPAVSNRGRSMDQMTDADMARAISPDGWLSITMMGVEKKPWHRSDPLPMPRLPDGKSALSGMGTRSSDNGFALNMARAVACIAPWSNDPAYEDLRAKAAGSALKDGPSDKMWERAETIVHDLRSAGWLGGSLSEFAGQFAGQSGTNRSRNTGPSRDSLRQ